MLRTHFSFKNVAANLQKTCKKGHKQYIEKIQIRGYNYLSEIICQCLLFQDMSMSISETI